MSQRKYKVTRKGEALGDLTLVQVRNHLKSGDIRMDDHYWDREEGEWKLVADIPNLNPDGDSTSAVWNFLFTGVLVGMIIIAPKLWNQYKEKDYYKPPALPQASKPLPPPAVKSRLKSTQSSGYDVASQQQGKAIDFAPFSRIGNELFPSRIIAGAAIPRSKHIQRPGEAPHYGVNGSIGVVVRNVRQGETYIINITGDRFISESSASYTIGADANAVVLLPTINYDFLALRRNTQTSSINLSFKVRRANEPEGRTIVRAWQVHQINDCPMNLGVSRIQADGSESFEQNKEIGALSGYVNENHPWIDALLVEARNTGICNEFIGYQGGREKIWPQIAAIWKALQNRGLTYANIAKTTSSTRNHFQHVRFLDETIANSQANCLDGSVLLASMLRKIGLNVGIMLVPGHAYVAICDEKNGTFIAAIETTLLGKADLNEATKVAIHGGKYPLKSYNEETYIYVDIERHRKLGYQPIPFESSSILGGALADRSGTSIGSPEEIARQQRIIIANGLRQHVSELLSRLNEKNNADFKAEAHNLFAEIRVHQSAFNSLASLPKLLPTGIDASDQALQERYYENVKTLRSRPINISPDVSENDIQSAKELADALFGIASLPLSF